MTLASTRATHNCFLLFCRLQGRISDHVPRAGTPVYLAPETLGNKSGSVNEPVDVYR
jgi:hypothetical protein